MSSDPRKSKRYQKLQSALRARRLPCWLCSVEIDYSAGKGEPLSFTADHVLPVHTHPERALDPTNLRAAHLRCNTRRQDGPPKPELGSPSRPW